MLSEYRIEQYYSSEGRNDEFYLTVFTESVLEDMFNDSWIRGQELTVPRKEQPAGPMGKRVLHMLIEEPVEILEHPEHSPDERWSITSSPTPSKLFDAEDSEGHKNTHDVEGHRQQGYAES